VSALQAETLSCPSALQDELTSEGESLPVTLQCVLSGSDGILIATDTKAALLPEGVPTIAPFNRVASETGKMRSAELGTQKVLLSASKQVAVACSGQQTISTRFAHQWLEEIERIWDASTNPRRDLQSFLSEKWMNCGDQFRKVGGTLLLAHSAKSEAFKAQLKFDALELNAFFRNRHQQTVLLGGDIFNPAGMLLELYLPVKPVSVDELQFLAAHFILTGGKLNTSQVGGLALCIARNNQAFEWANDELVAALQENSERLHRNIRRRLSRTLS
jgi:hypothetical protein